MRAGDLQPDLIALRCEEFVYVTWDYRGFFASDAPARPRRISIPEHAQDALEALAAAGYGDRCTNDVVMVGHSMGVAVALEATLLFPERIGALVLLNGFHGHVFQTAFQPLVRVLFAGDLIYALVEALLACSESTLEGFRRLSESTLSRVTMPLYARLFGSPLLRSLQPPGARCYLETFFAAYWGALCADSKSARSYLRLFLELDAHSVWHLLPSIEQPVLLVSGFHGMVTPAMQSVELARRLPRATHYCDPYSSHASLLESPERCLAEIELFLATHVLPPAPAAAAAGDKGGAKAKTPAKAKPN